MKNIARSYFWWPNLDKDISNLTKACEACTLNFNIPNKCALQKWDWPSTPFERIHIDYMFFEGNYFLIITDAHSKWLEVFHTKNMTTKITIDALRSNSTRFGLPKILVSDNATMFESVECKNSFNNNNINHITSPPYHAQSNGAAENSVKTVKNALKKSLHNTSLSYLNLTLNNFLFDYRNTTHASTGASPAQLMFGRNLRNRFSQVLPDSRLNDFIPCKSNVEKSINKANARQKKNFRGNRNVQFAVGDVVLARNYKNVSKPTWSKGLITKKISKTMYIVKIPELNNIEWKRHVDQLLTYKVDNLPLNMYNEAKDNSEPSGSGHNSRPQRIRKEPERLNYH